MATIRVPEKIWETTREHLFGTSGEHFAFFLAHWSYSSKEPIYLVRDVICIPDQDIVGNWSEMEISLGGILSAVNTAVRGSECLIEIHNHGGARPRFSITDRRNLPEFVEYILSSLPGRPYAATVWGDTTVYGEYFLPDGRTGAIDSIMVLGTRLRQVVSRQDDSAQIDPVFARQLPWFTSKGQQQLGQLKVGVVGCGGTGSHVIQNLVYLGIRDFVLVDHDCADESNMNRLVIATAADIGTPKTILGRRIIKSVAPNAKVSTFQAQLRALHVLDALKGVDALFGCVDNDGARLILNELALAYSIPYIDVAVGIEAESGLVESAGGRVATVLPGGPCLHCMNQIDVKEADFFLSSPEEQTQNLDRGYVTGVDVPAPAVVSINAQLAATSVNELAVLISGVRPLAHFLEYDLLGHSRKKKSQWLSPVAYKKDKACIECTLAGLGDNASIESRFGLSD